MNFIEELRRRRVVRVAVVYAITGWLLVQISAIAFPAFGMPEWTLRGIMIVLATGFPVALVLAWAFELTPEGVQRTRSAEQGGLQIKPVGRSRFDYAIIGLMIVAIGWLLYRAEFDTPEPVEPALPVADLVAEPKVLHNSIAVLPFENLSPNPDDAYFAAGMHEEVLNQLAKIKDLTVIARTTMMRYQESDKSVPEIAAELNVIAVMEGSVRYAGDKVRITTQLNDASTGAHLWSEAYDRELTNIFAIQSDIALKVTEAMKAEFSVAEQQAIAKVLTENSEAYAHYVKAWLLLRGFEATAPIHVELDAAIALDPNFSAALAFKGWLHGWQIIAPFAGNVITPESERIDAALAEEYGQKALAINPNEGGGYMALSLADQYHRRWSDALENAARAYNLNPNQPIILAQYANRLAAEGRTEEAIELWYRVVALDPQNFATHGSSAFNFYTMERWDLLRTVGQNMVTLFPEIPHGYAWLGLAEAYLGNEQEALALARQVEARASNTGFLWPSQIYSVLGRIYSVLGRDEDLSRAFDRFVKADKEQPADAESWFDAYVSVGKYEEALDLLHDAIDNHSASALVMSLKSFYMHPVYAPLRGNPRFDDALRKLGVEVRDQSL